MLPEENSYLYSSYIHINFTSSVFYLKLPYTYAKETQKELEKFINLDHNTLVPLKASSGVAKFCKSEITKLQ